MICNRDNSTEAFTTMVIAVLGFLAIPWQQVSLADSDSRLIAQYDEKIPEWMAEHNTPGVSLVLIRSKEIAWQQCYGVREAGSGEPVTTETVFEAASMSKPLFAYAVMKIAEEGKIDLDRPLVDYLNAPYLDDDLHLAITARMVLDHTTGFPNWRPGGRRSGNPVPVKFTPGSEFGYSGEGFWYLQQVVEAITGESLAPWMEETVLEPLGMTSSSYAWREEYESLAAAGHDGDGQVRTNRPRYRGGNAAFTLFTTPTDYARFLIAMMQDGDDKSSLLNRESLEAMLAPSVATDDPDVWRGLGWVITKNETKKLVSHSGSNRSGFRCASRFSPATGDGIVIMTNATGGRSVWQKVLELP